MNALRSCRLTFNSRVRCSPGNGRTAVASLDRSHPTSTSFNGNSHTLNTRNTSTASNVNPYKSLQPIYDTRLGFTSKPIISQRRLSTLSSLLQAQPISVHHSTSFSITQQEDELLSQFDSPSVSASSTSTTIPASGLFLHPSLDSPQSFLSLTQKTLFRAQLLVSRIISAPQNGENEMQKVVRNLDRLSDLLCGIIDFAELIRNASPDPNWVEAANAGYEYLCGYMNVLNTSTGLYDVSERVGTRSVGRALI